MRATIRTGPTMPVRPSGDVICRVRGDCGVSGAFCPLSSAPHASTPTRLPTDQPLQRAPSMALVQTADTLVFVREVRVTSGPEQLGGELPRLLAVLGERQSLIDQVAGLTATHR